MTEVARSLVAVETPRCPVWCTTDHMREREELFPDPACFHWSPTIEVGGIEMSYLVRQRPAGKEPDWSDAPTLLVDGGPAQLGIAAVRQLARVLLESAHAMELAWARESTDRHMVRLP